MLSLTKQQQSWQRAMASNRRYRTCLRYAEKYGLAWWAEKKATKAPELKSLPPTKEAFEENVKRAHIQTAIWKSALQSDPPPFDPVEFGWERDERAKCLKPVTLQPDVSVAPSEVLEMIRCGCSTETPCSTAMCGCYTGHLSCTIFCGCHGDAHCQNEHNRRVDDDVAENDDLIEDLDNQWHQHGDVLWRLDDH